MVLLQTEHKAGNYPFTVSGETPVVDTLSGGRVEIGVGSGGSELEYAA